MISELSLDKGYIPIESPDEIVQADWGYAYDLEFFDAPTNPDMAVDPKWVGKRAKDVCFAWEYFYKPVANWQI